MPHPHHPLHRIVPTQLPRYAAAFRAGVQRDRGRAAAEREPSTRPSWARDFYRALLAVAVGLVGVAAGSTGVILLATDVPSWRLGGVALILLTLWLWTSVLEKIVTD